MSEVRTTAPPTAPVGDEIYVGYLPVPPGYARFLRIAVPALLLIVIGAAATWSAAARSPGDAVWETDKLVEVEGVAVEEPYAILRMLDDHVEGGVRAVPLVQGGKRGGRELVAGLDGRYVRFRGYWLVRDGHRLLEVTEPATPVEAPVSPRLATRLSPSDSASITISGEIIDPKCYFGAMKPGEGKTHKACATLCVKGGIPPMLVTRNAGGPPVYLILTDPAGTAANEFVLPYVGDRVTIRGTVTPFCDLPLLSIAADGIRRD